MRAASTSAAVTAFHALHREGCFVMANAWDVGSAILLASLGFRALGSTSSGYAFTRGLPDALGVASLEDTLGHLRELVAATPLPLSADFQDGHATEPEDVARHVDRCAATGVAGLSIEDATGDAAAPLHERALAVERVRAARVAIDRSGTGALLTARCEAFLVGDPEPTRTVLDRLVAYAEAGADCLFAPRVSDPAVIAAIVKAVAPRAVNVLVTAPSPELTIARLTDLGVCRISVGSGLARVAWGAFRRAARELAENGSFEGMVGSAPLDELDALFRARMP